MSGTGPTFIGVTSRMARVTMAVLIGKEKTRWKWRDGSLFVARCFGVALRRNILGAPASP